MRNLSFNCLEDVDVLGCIAVWTSKNIPMFRRNTVFIFTVEINMETIFLRNFGTYLQVRMASQLRGSTSTE